MNPCEETKEQFTERHQRGWATPSVFEKHLVAMPCDCEEGGGPTHWAAIDRGAGMIEHHLQFNAPEGTPWPEEVERDGN